MPEQTDTHTAERLVLVDRALWVDRGDGNRDGLTGELPPWADDWAAGIVEAVNERVDLLAQLVAARARVTELEAQRDRVRELHQPIEAVNMRHPGGRLTRVCSGCGTDDGNWQTYPCPTIRAQKEVDH
ncbi:hypothetical protein IU449_27370 [Nocardia higoensis]|uniref:Uncharacterized protein n=1 Tax=Nocardia higoensis TaxID=228599 RepID=A0ABS0DID2_9NOCA|nr:hypothetical protein [Nocardia higoensis]MBF6358222.1 hypothetical protein [Nocardia higoensis]